MFINSKVNHKKFGSGVITDMEINSENQLKSRVNVKFDNGKESKFAMEAFGSNGFFITDDEAIIPFVDKLRDEAKEKELAELKRRADAITYVPRYEFDEYNHEVTVDDWKKAASVAGSYRFPNESRAVIMDSDLIFINASAAMKYMESRIKDCDKVYKACENNGKFQGHEWRYANTDDINHIIELIEEGNDTK